MKAMAIYYQVAATVRDEMTLKRELASLQRISDQYPKYILTLDDDPSADYDGIKRINALKWLMGSLIDGDKANRHVTFAVACLIRYVLGRLKPRAVSTFLQRWHSRHARRSSGSKGTGWWLLGYAPHAR